VAVVRFHQVARHRPAAVPAEGAQSFMHLFSIAGRPHR
jgi:hypothetical protein